MSSAISGLAQESNLHRLTLQVDNDSFVLRRGDKYYTSGIFVHYEFNANKFPLLKSGGEIVVKTTLGQKMYTPSDSDIDIVEVYDRPFAGWLFASIDASKQKENQIFGIGLELGVTGNASQSKALHRWFHRAFNFSEIPTWKDQIPSEFMFNLSSVYKKEVLNNMFAESVATLGTKDVFFQQGFYFSFFENLKEFNQLAVSKKVSAYTAVKYRFVGYDALIEGSIWNNNAPLTKDVVRHLFLAEAGVKFLINKIQFGISYHYNTKQTSQAQGHIYGNLKMSYNF